MFVESAALRRVKPSATLAATDKARELAVLNVRLPTGGNRAEIEVPEMAPTVQHDAAPERLPFGSDNKTIILAPIARVRLTPAHLEAGESQYIKGD